MKLSVIAFRNIRRNKVRTALTLIAIAFVTMLIVVLFSFIQGMKADVMHTMVNFTNGHIRIQQKDYEEKAVLYPLDMLVDNYHKLCTALEKIDGVETATPRIQFGLEIGINPKKRPGIADEYSDRIRGIGYGVDFKREKYLSNLGLYLQEGSDNRLPEGDGVVLGSELAQQLGVKANDTIVVFHPTRENLTQIPMRIKVTGVMNLPIAQLNARAIYFPVELAASKLGIEGSTTQILLAIKDGRDPAQMIKKINTELPKTFDKNYLDKLQIQPWTEIGFMVEWIAIAENSYNFIAVFFFLMAGTVIAVTTMMVIFERMKEIGTMAAMGMTGSQMVGLFFLEAFFMSLVASIIGVILGIVLVIPLTQSGINFNAFMNFEDSGFIISNYIYPQLNVNSTIFVFFFSIFIASGISAIFARRAGKIEPIEALNSL
ncbi:MAG: ABC transporter permease [Spirochaetales bacterium]|nr:ABC transporter permease [Spirochaetales bacterium]